MGYTQHNESVLNFLWDDEAQTSRVKRPTEEQYSQRRASLQRSEIKMKSKAFDLVVKINKEVRGLADITRASRNTKVEIKEAIEKITDYMATLTQGEILGSMATEENTNSIIMVEDTVEMATQTTTPQQTQIKKLKAEITTLKNKITRMKNAIQRGSPQQGKVEISSLTGVDTLEDYKKIVWNPWNGSLLEKIELSKDREITNTRDAVVKIF